MFHVISGPTHNPRSSQNRPAENFVLHSKKLSCAHFSWKLLMPISPFVLVWPAHLRDQSLFWVVCSFFSRKKFRLSLKCTVWKLSKICSYLFVKIGTSRGPGVEPSGRPMLFSVLSMCNQETGSAASLSDKFPVLWKNRLQFQFFLFCKNSRRGTLSKTSAKPV